MWTTALFALLKLIKGGATDDNLRALNELIVDFPVEDDRGGRSMGAAGGSHFHDAVGRRQDEEELRERVATEFDDVRRRLTKYRERSREASVYVSPQYRTVQSLLDSVQAAVPRIATARADGQLQIADDLLWQCGVDLESCKNMMKAV